MNKKNIITITGKIASGKSQVIKKIAKELGMEIYKGSSSFRRLARENKMDLTTFNSYVSKYPDIDRQIDKDIEEYAKAHENCIIDARVGWHFVPKSFKIYIDVDINIAAKRLQKDSKNRDREEHYMTQEEAKQAILIRQELEHKRYIDEYNIDILDMFNYDLVLDSSNSNLENTEKEIIASYKKWLKDK